MRLDVDIGNTRVKWRLHGEGFSESGALAWRDWEAASQVVQALLGRMRDKNPDGVQAVVVTVSSVAGPKTEALFTHWLSDKLGAQPHYIQVEQNVAGVVIAYDDAAKLGVDRWLAMLAAHDLKPGFNVVIDAGSALTIDYVNPSGLHEGGLIVPGFSMVAAAMSLGAHALSPSRDSESLTLPQNWQPGCDTVSGITQGSSAMYRGLVNEALAYYISRAEGEGALINVFLCGGDAAVLAPWCEPLVAAEQLIVKDGLVLDGIDVWRQHRA